MRLLFWKSTQSKTAEPLLDNAMASQISKLILEDVKKDYPKQIKIITEAYFKGHGDKIDKVIDGINSQNKILDNILEELKDQGDERVEHTKKLGFLQTVIEALEETFNNRSKGVERAAKEGAMNGAHEVIPSTLEAMVEPKQHRIKEVVIKRGIFGRFFKGGEKNE